jgi:hypothetical protein
MNMPRAVLRPDGVLAWQPRELQAAPTPDP